MQAEGLDATGGGALGICFLIGLVGFQGNDVTGQAWFEGAGGGGAASLVGGVR